MSSFISSTIAAVFVAILLSLLSPGGAYTFAAGAPFAEGTLVNAGMPEDQEGSQSISERIRDMTPAEKIAYLLKEKAKGEESAEVDFFLGVAMYATGKLDSATIFFRQAVRKDSTYSKAYVNLGIVLESQGKRREAEAMYSRALEIDPSDVLAHCHLGFLYHSQGRPRKAMDQYRRALEIDPDSPQAHYNLGYAFADARMFKEALREWELVIQLDPDGELGKTASENVKLIKQYMEVQEP